MFSKRYFNELNNLQMKKSVVFYSLFLLLLLAGCHEREVSLTESGKRTQELRDRYQKFVVGSWYYTHAASREKVYVHYNLSENQKYTMYCKLAHRDSISVDGKPVYGDWKMEEEVAEGDWSLRCHDVEGNLENQLILEEHHEHSVVASVNQFVYADENILVFNDIWFRGNPNTYHRGNPGADF